MKLTKKTVVLGIALAFAALAFPETHVIPSAGAVPVLTADGGAPPPPPVPVPWSA